ncbi:MAG: integron integrase [Desulforhopalus sp.]|nr:integron integrase [Desulforhopalus sp.]
MNNNNMFRSADFGIFLLESKFVPPGKEKFLVHWTRKFFQYCNELPNIAWPKQLPLFLEHLNASEGFEDWQIRQADHAVRLYFNNFLSPKDIEKERILLPSTSPKNNESALKKFNEALRLRNYALRTVKTYLGWVRQYLNYCKRHGGNSSHQSPQSSALVRDFLAHLAIKSNVSASTQNLAFNSLLIYYRFVFNEELGDLKHAVRARTGKKVPVVFSTTETCNLLKQVTGTTGLMLKIIYGGGLRVTECCRLRIKDIDFDQQLIHIRDGKGGKDRTTLLAESVISELRSHIGRVYDLHDADLANGFGAVWLPNALSHKYPNAEKQKAWQYLFPSRNRSIDPRTNIIRRHHISDSAPQRAMKKAIKVAGIHKHASVHSLRHYATHLLLNGIDIRQIQEYLGHAKVETTMIYTHVIKDMRNPVASPLDLLDSTKPAL